MFGVILTIVGLALSASSLGLQIANGAGGHTSYGNGYAPPVPNLGFLAQNSIARAPSPLPPQKSNAWMAVGIVLVVVLLVSKIKNS